MTNSLSSYTFGTRDLKRFKKGESLEKT